MGDPKDPRQMVAANLRSVTQSCKGGVPFDVLERDYRSLLGKSIPYHSLGYSSLEAMLRDMPDVVSLQRNSSGKLNVLAVADESTAHIASLIARQKTTKKPVRTGWPSRVRRVPVSQSQSVRQFNKGSRVPPRHLRMDFQAHSQHNNILDARYEISRSAQFPRSEHIQSPRAKVAPVTFGPNYTVPPRFSRKQEQPLASLENNSTDDYHEPSVPTSKAHHSFPTSLPPTRREKAHLPAQHTKKPESRSAREYIEKYAGNKNLNCSFRTQPIGQKRPKYVCVLTLGDEQYRTYPEMIRDTKEEAEEAAAELAKEAIRKSEEGQKSLPVTSIHDEHSLELMLERIDQIVAEKPKGLWNTSIPSEYEQKYEERLPEEWFTQVKKCCSFYYTDIDDGRIILYPSADSGRTSPTSTSSTVDDEGTEMVERKFSELSIAVPQLDLPKSSHFDVFVCNVQDAECVAVRLLDHAESFAELSDKMKAFYDSNKLPVTSVSMDKPYAAFIDEFWHRVLIEERKSEVLLCQLVDEGDFVEVKIGCLQEMDPEFLKLPFQAVSYRLAELDAYSVFINQQTLETCLLGKPLVAEVVDSNKNSIILYDTTTEEDINLNLVIFEKTVSESLKYTLPQCGVSAVAYLSHVSPDGTVYLTLNSPTLPSLLLEELQRISPTCEEKANLQCDISPFKMYCAKYESDAIWYRAIIVDTAKDKNEVEVLYVDYGNTSWIPLSSICELSPISKYLAELPFQAVRCNLRQIPPANLHWSVEVTKRLTELAPYGKELLVRVEKPDTEVELAEVSLFIRNENSEIVSINQTLLFDDKFSQEPSTKCGHLHSRISEFLAMAQKKECSSQSTSLVRAPVDLPSPVPAENTSSEQGNLSNFIPDVAVSAEQQIAKKHGAVSHPAVVNECDHEVEQYPPLYPPEVPEPGMYFDVFVTMAASPFNFVCQPLKSSKALDQLHSEMQLFYSTEENLCDMHSVLVKEGEFFAGKHTDGFWYRVRKLNIVCEEPLQVSVYFVDYGDICILSLPNLQPLFKQFRLLPCQAMRASLKNIRPNGHDWDPLECIEFKTMVEEKQFVSILQSKQLRKEDCLTVYCIELLLIDTSDPEVDCFIHEELIKKNLARRLEVQ